MRAGVDFSNVLTKHVPRTLNGIATENYFAALQTITAPFASFDATVDTKYGKRLRIIPSDVAVPTELKSSTKAAFFTEKRHTKITKAKKATPVVEVAESMMNDENTALLNDLPDRFADADSNVDDILKIIENVTNPDHVLKKIAESAPAFNSAMSLKMAGHGTEIYELAQLHMINRVLSATTPGDDSTFRAKWKQLMDTTVPSQRSDLFKACAKWWTRTDQTHEFSRFTKALGVYELALMSAAPTIFTKDHCIQYITGEPFHWIPAHHVRLLHPNRLLLRSDLGALCMEKWRQVQWQGHQLDDLEELRKLDGEYPVDESVLQLHVADDGSVTLMASGLASRC